METPNSTQNEPNKGNPVYLPAKSKFGITGLILGIFGFIISGSMLLLIYMIAMAGGGLDIMLTSSQSSTIVSAL